MIRDRNPDRDTGFLWPAAIAALAAAAFVLLLASGQPAPGPAQGTAPMWGERR